MVRLKKIDVERLTATFDRDPVAALTVALRRTTERPTAEWAELVAALPIDELRMGLLRVRDSAALEELLRDLIELREVPATETDGSGT